MASYKETVLDIVDRLTCPHCKEIFTNPLTLDCRHSVCLACAEKIGSKNKEGQRCCYCPQCGAESVMKYTHSRVNWTLWEAADVVHVVTASLWKGRSTPETYSDGDSGVWDIKSESSFGSSCSISSMQPPPYMASTRELFDRMLFLMDGLKSEDELSQRSSGSSDCSEREQRSEDEPSARRTLPGSGRYLIKTQFKSKLPQQRINTSTRAQMMDLLTQTTSDGTQVSEYKTRGNKQALLDIVDRLTCPHCKEIFTDPVTLDCGHNVCLACAEKISSKNTEGQRRCCCPKCGAESVTEDIHFRTNWTLLEAAALAHVVTASLGKGGNTPEVRSAGDSESGIGDLKSESSLGTSCSINSMPLPPRMASTRELFIRMFLPTDGLGSEEGLSQRPSGSSDCSEIEQWSEDGTSARGLLSGSGGLCDPELPQQSALTSIRAQIMDLLTRMTSDGTQRSLYKTSPYKQVFVDILEPFTCPHCKKILRVPVILHCGHTVCLSCAREIGSKNKAGQRCYCCPKCEEESVREYLFPRFNLTMLFVALVLLGVAVFMWKATVRPLSPIVLGQWGRTQGQNVLSVPPGPSEA